MSELEKRVEVLRKALKKINDNLPYIKASNDSDAQHYGYEIASIVDNALRETE
jgi:hypothetical protein